MAFIKFTGDAPRCLLRHPRRPCCRFYRRFFFFFFFFSMIGRKPRHPDVIKRSKQLSPGVFIFSAASCRRLLINLTILPLVSSHFALLDHASFLPGSSSNPLARSFVHSFVRHSYRQLIRSCFSLSFLPTRCLFAARRRNENQVGFNSASVHIRACTSTASSTSCFPSFPAIAIIEQPALSRMAGIIPCLSPSLSLSLFLSTRFLSLRVVLSLFPLSPSRCLVFRRSSEIRP